MEKGRGYPSGCCFVWTARNWLATRVMILPYLDSTSGLKPWGSPADEATELVLCDPANLDLTTFLDLRPFAGFCVRFAGCCARCAAFLDRKFAQKTTNGQTKGQFLLPVPVPVLAPLLSGTIFTEHASQARNALLFRNVFVFRKPA